MRPMVCHAFRKAERNGLEGEVNDSGWAVVWVEVSGTSAQMGRLQGFVL